MIYFFFTLLRERIMYGYDYDYMRQNDVNPDRYTDRDSNALNWIGGLVDASLIVYIAITI